MAETESEQAEPKPLAAKPKPKPATSHRRKEYSLAKKLQVVRETMAPGASVSIVARRHDINSNLVFAWRKQYKSGELQMAAKKNRKSPGLVPVEVIGQHELHALPGPELLNGHHHEHGLIEIETGGGMKIRLSGRVDDRMLSLVLSEVRRRP